MENGKRVLVSALFPLLSLKGESRVGLSHKALRSWCTQLRNRSGTEGSGARRQHYQMMLMIILMNIHGTLTMFLTLLRALPALTCVILTVTPLFTWETEAW